MGLGGLGLKLRVELDGKEPGVIGGLDNFDQRTIGTETGGNQTILSELRAEAVVELVAVPMPLMDQRGPVGGKSA